MTGTAGAPRPCDGQPAVPGRMRDPGGLGHPGSPPDAGLQPERTDLSWRRTLLALVIASLFSIRLLAPLLGNAALLAGIAGLTVCVGLAAVTAYRVKRLHRWFRWRVVQERRSSRVPMMPDAEPGPAFALLVATVLVSCGALAALLQAVLL